VERKGGEGEKKGREEKRGGGGANKRERRRKVATRVRLRRPRASQLNALAPQTRRAPLH